MFIPRIYLSQPLSSGIDLPLEKEISHHLMHVLRLKDQEKVIVFNGAGGEYEATFCIHKKTVAKLRLSTFHNISRCSLLPCHLGQGLARGDRMDFVIQKATELGVSSVTPLFTTQSIVKLESERAEKKHQHWQKIAISASEQCGRTDIPVIYPPCSLTEWVHKPFSGYSIIFDTTNIQPLNTIVPTPKAFRLAIGPEAGWHPQEKKLLLHQAFQPHSLGPRILRTETAGLAALSILQGLFGDLSKN